MTAMTPEEKREIVGRFGSDENEVHIVGHAGESYIARAPKTEVARAILDALTSEMGQNKVRKD